MQEKLKKSLNVGLFLFNQRVLGAVNKSLGHQLACDAMLDYLIGTGESENENQITLNIVGEFNVAGDLWAIKPLIEKMGVNILCAIPVILM